MLEVAHGAVLLSWQAPTENEDDTPLADLHSFDIYWGNDQVTVSQTVAVIGAGITSYQFVGFAPGVYYFATTP